MPKYTMNNTVINNFEAIKTVLSSVTDGQGEALYVDMSNDDLFGYIDNIPSSFSPQYINKNYQCTEAFDAMKKTILYYFDNGDYIYSWGIHFKNQNRRDVLIFFHKSGDYEPEKFSDLILDLDNDDYKRRQEYVGFQKYQTLASITNGDFMIANSVKYNYTGQYGDILNLKLKGITPLFCVTFAIVTLETDSGERSSGFGSIVPYLETIIYNSYFNWNRFQKDDSPFSDNRRYDYTYKAEYSTNISYKIDKDNHVFYPENPLKEGDILLDGISGISDYGSARIYKPNDEIRSESFYLVPSDHLSLQWYGKSQPWYDIDDENYCANLITSHINETGSDGYYNPEVYDIPIDRNIDHDPNSKSHPDDDDYTGGGDGDYDYTSDIIHPDDLPDYNEKFTSTGMIHAYAPNDSELRDLATAMWDDDAFATINKKLHGNPIEAIISLHQLPVSFSGSEISRSRIRIGSWLSKVETNFLTVEYVTVDCGKIFIKPWTKTALDYSPYVKATIFLPFIGYHDIDIDEIMCKTIGIKYRINILTGNCIALISVDDNTLYQFSGQCSQQIPLTSKDMSQLMTGMLRAVAMTGTVVASGGFGAGAVDTFGATDMTGVGQMAGVASNVMSGKAMFPHSNTLTGNTGFIGIQRAYFIFHCPNHCSPKNYQNIKGFPYMSTQTISKCTGFTVIHDIRLSNLSCTNEEKEELYTILKKGVII